VALTHDVDRLHAWHWTELSGSLRRAAARLVRGCDVRACAGELMGMARRLCGGNPWWNFSALTDLERQRGFSSTFFLSVARRHPYDNLYHPETSGIRSLIHRLLGAGFEIGLHRSIDPGSPDRERRALERITGRPAGGVRCHYLSLDVRRDFEVLEQAGFRYDTTLGFPDRVGLRGGWPFPYRPYDFRRERAFGILEIPLAVMDTTLMSYLNLTPREGWEVTRALLEALREAGGAAAILWHNGRGGEWGEVYRSILDFLRENGGIGLRAEDLARWWQEGTGAPLMENLTESTWPESHG